MIATRTLRLDHSDADFCWEQILRTRPAFGISHAYAPAECSAGLLALYALFVSLEELFCRITEEQVARAKLAWWQTQLLGPEYTVSDHPVIRKLRQSGAITQSAREHVQTMLSSAVHRLDLTAPVDESGLKSLCVIVALDQMKIEMSFLGASPGICLSMENACAVMGLIQIMRESSRCAFPEYKWIPLNLLAHHAVTRPDFALNPDSESVQKLMAQLCAIGLTWIPEGQNVCKNSRLMMSMQDVSATRHWLIQLRLSIRLLQNLQGKTSTEANRLFSRTALGDAWCAWRCARKLAP
jgi:phytoene synthase